MFRRTVGRHALMPPPVPGCVRREISRNRNCLTGGHKARPYIPTPGLLVGARIARPRRSASYRVHRNVPPHRRAACPHAAAGTGCVRREISRNRNCLTGGYIIRPYRVHRNVPPHRRAACPHAAAGTGLRSAGNFQESQLPHGRIFNPPLQGAAEFPPRLKTAQKSSPSQGSLFMPFLSL